MDVVVSTCRESPRNFPRWMRGRITPYAWQIESDERDNEKYRFGALKNLRNYDETRFTTFACTQLQFTGSIVHKKLINLLINACRIIRQSDKVAGAANKSTGDRFGASINPRNYN